MELNCCRIMASPRSSLPVNWSASIAAPIKKALRNASLSAVGAGACALTARLKKKKAKTKNRFRRRCISIFSRVSRQGQTDPPSFRVNCRPQTLGPHCLFGKNTRAHLEALAALAQIMRDGQVEFHIDAIEEQAASGGQEPCAGVHGSD